MQIFCDFLQGLALSGMPDIECMDALVINCNTIDTQTSCEQISKMQTDDLGYTNREHNAEAQSQGNTNTGGI